MSRLKSKETREAQHTAAILKDARIHADCECNPRMTLGIIGRRRWDRLMRHLKANASALAPIPAESVG